MAVNLSPIWGAGAQLLDNSGNVLSGGKIYTYLAGTTTPAVTYTSSSGNIANSNPIILNAAGRVPYEIWLTDGISYKYVLKDTNDVLISTLDNLIGISSVEVGYIAEQEIQTATAGQTVFNLTTLQYIPNTHNISVFVDGINQYGPGASYEYEETSTTSITFNTSLTGGESVKFTTASLVASNVGNAENVAYNPPFVGSVATNVEAKLAQTVSPKDFGAVGDGVTNDKAAVKAALESGYIVDGAGLTYAIDGTCAPTSFVGLQNANFIQIGNNSATNFNTLDIVGISDFFIDNVKINMGSNVTTLFSPDGTNNGLNVSGNAYNDFITNFKITRVSVTGNGCGAGIHVSNAQQFVVDNCLVYDRISGSSPDPTDDSQNGIWINNGSSFVLSNCVVNNLKTRLSGVNTNKWTRGILLVESVDCTIADCVVTTADQCFDFSGGYQAIYGFTGNRNFTISGCTANNAGTWGFKFANVAKDGIVTGCIANNSANAGFVISTTADTVALEYHTQRIDFVGCKVVNVLGVGNAGTLSEGFYIQAGSGGAAAYPNAITFKDCSVVDNQAIPTTDGGFASGAALITYPTTGYNKTVANTVSNCSVSSTVADPYHGLIGPDYCAVNGTAAQSIPNNTQTDLVWDADISDLTGLHSTTSNAQNVYIKTPGWYRIETRVSFDTDAVGARVVRLLKNGSIITGGETAILSVAGIPTEVSLFSSLYLVSGDAIGVAVQQGTGGALNVLLQNSYFSVTRFA